MGEMMGGANDFRRPLFLPVILGLVHRIQTPGVHAVPHRKRACLWILGTRPRMTTMGGHSPFTIPSTIFLASANSIMVLSRKNSSFSTPA